MSTKSEALKKRMIRRHELRQIVPLADTTIYEMEQRGEFPRRFALTPRCVVWDRFMRSLGIVHTAFSKSTSSQTASCSSLLRTIVSRKRRIPSRIVGSVATWSSCLSITRISVGDSDRSLGTNVAIEAGPTSSAGLATFSPCKIANP